MSIHVLQGDDKRHVAAVAAAVILFVDNEGDANARAKTRSDDIYDERLCRRAAHINTY